MSYVHIFQKEDRLWTVGFYEPDGRWHPVSDHDTEDEASNRVARLNGAAPALDSDQLMLISDVIRETINDEQRRLIAKVVDLTDQVERQRYKLNRLAELWRKAGVLGFAGQDQEACRSLVMVMGELLLEFSGTQSVSE